MHTPGGRTAQGFPSANRCWDLIEVEVHGACGEETLAFITPSVADRSNPVPLVVGRSVDDQVDLIIVPAEVIVYISPPTRCVALWSTGPARRGP